MRILQVSAGYPPFLGGAEVYAQTIAERFVKDGHQVSVICSNACEVEYYWHPQKHHIPGGRSSLNGVEIMRCPVRHLPLSPYSFYLLRRMATMIASLPRLSLPVLRSIAPLMPQISGMRAALNSLPAKIDVVHGINIALEWPLIAAWRYARQHNLPFITTPFVHVGDATNNHVLKNYVMPHQLEVLCDADRVIAQTAIEKQALVKLGVSDETIEVVGMGVDLHNLVGGDAEVFRQQQRINKPVITFLGVVTREKGSFHLIRAVEQLWAQGVQCELVIAGPTVDEFTRFFAGLEPATQTRIKLMGVVQGKIKQDLLAATDIFVLPSCIDSFGIVFLEAWSYGKPVIGGNAGGIPDVISHGKDGLLVDYGDIDGLAQAIRTLLSDPELRQKLGAAGRKKTETRYTWESIYNHIRGICETVQR